MRDPDERASDDAPDDPVDREARTRRERKLPVRAAPAPRVSKLERGTMLGRYVVLEVLGRGGMGVVYAAYDPELDRRVAIKLLQMRAAHGDQTWLLREAQALARLAHPNVVAVHDVGTLPGDRVFVAMEHVEGDTLREWLAAPRPWQQVLPVMLAAGAGLAAAHEAGLVHRDFKPENVLVGSDGRVRVMDFGLARLQVDHVPERGDPAAELGAEPRPLEANLTKAGSVIGTPAYMAPEVHACRPADPRSDQFSFAVTLYEALYRTRPFTAEQLARPGAELAPRPVPRLGVPPRVHDATLRALAIDREARFPSMAALLARLQREPRPRPAVLVSAALGAVAAAAITFLALHSTSDGPALDPCAGGEARLEGVWDPATRARVTSAFHATGRAFAVDTLSRVTGHLDRYAESWVATRREVCEATQVRHEQSPIAFDLRMHCLRERLDVLRALADVFATADARVLDNAVQAAATLPPAEPCATLAPGATPPPTAAQAAQLEPLERELAELTALSMAGRYPQVEAGIGALLERARRVDHASLTGRVMFQAAVAHIGTSKHAEAERLLREALDVAAAAHDDDLIAQLWTYLIVVVGQDPERHAEALRLQPVAEVAIKRAPRGRMLQGDLDYNLATIYLAKGDAPRAIEHFNHAIALRGRALGGRDTDVWKMHLAIGGAYLKTANLVRAKQHFEQALVVIEDAYGPTHPSMGFALSALAAFSQALMSFDDAFAQNHRALEIFEDAYGEDHAQVGLVLYNLGVCKNGLEDYAAAIPYYERAIAVLEREPNHPYLGLALVGLADCREEVGQARRAVLEAERGLELVARSSDAVQLAYARFVLARALWSARYQRPRAIALATEARKGFEAAGLPAFNGLMAVDKWFDEIGQPRR